MRTSHQKKRKRDHPNTKSPRGEFIPLPSPPVFLLLINRDLKVAIWVFTFLAIERGFFCWFRAILERGISCGYFGFAQSV
ncbi:hypothetical protein FRX31_007340 [Thalictrum thalictroides]|uniref:Uncharacterized protein n=1 Tax=Thalictrum thalictroides TaxID=46969 RepID=A0A7J6X2F1_THATH|nr:hypothetical protein FRX31_007340 [Thalictrum thalictroides]